MAGSFNFVVSFIKGLLMEWVRKRTAVLFIVCTLIILLTTVHITCQLMPLLNKAYSNYMPSSS